MPEALARLPSRMNIGTARMGELLTPESVCCTATPRPTPGPSGTQARDGMRSANATGTRSRSRTSSATTMTARVISGPLPFGGLHRAGHVLGAAEVVHRVARAVQHHQGEAEGSRPVDDGHGQAGGGRAQAGR